MSRVMLTTPHRIASYTLLEPIGHGGMATVFRARQDTLDRIVAVKVLAEHLAAAPEFIERFRREARTAANLRHPNVITVHDFGQDDRGVPYLVLEYIEGATLADLMDSGLDDARIPDLLDQIAAGLDYAHARGVIHRDIKPGNVLMTQDGRAVLADFGLAWLAHGAQLTITGSVIGTPEYISPEQACGDPIDHRCDIYSLGVMLYEMLTGERPFAAETPVGVLLKHLQEPAPSLLDQRPELPVEVDAVVARALAKDPDERYASAGELARSFRAAFLGGPPSASADIAADSNTAARSSTTGAQPSKSAAQSSNGAAHSSAIAVQSSASVTQSSASAAQSSTVTAESSTIGCGADSGNLTAESSDIGRSAESRSRTHPAPAEHPTAPAPCCPACAAELPQGAGICPACMYMIPFDQLPRTPRPRKVRRREMVLNLLPYRLRWDPDGLAAARQLAADALREASVDGWEPASIGEPYRLVRGRTMTGAIVESAVLRLERFV